MNINISNYKDFPRNCSGFYLHDFKIHTITLNIQKEQIVILGQEITKPEVNTTLVFNNVLSFEAPNFKPWGNSDGIVNGISVDYITLEHIASNLNGGSNIKVFQK